MKYKIFIVLLSVFLFFFLQKKQEATLHLIWHKSYEDDTLLKTETGLKWALSYLGASILNEKNIKKNNNTFTIDYLEMGFSKNAEKSLQKIHQKIKESEEYKFNNYIDVGRYVSLLLGSSEHYYALIETPKTLEEITKNYKLKSEKGYINNSSVSNVHRIIQYSEQTKFNQLFLSQEIDSVSGEVYEFETIELLKNGQLRFGIFDENGNRKIAADSKHTTAGKPAKCIWCHESNIQPLYKDQKNNKGYLPFLKLQQSLEHYRSQYNIDKIKSIDVLNYINYKQTQDHTFTEILYTSFMEPSAKRLALEWNLTEKQVLEKLKNYKTHQHIEFNFLGNLYHRNEIECLAPYKNLSVSGSIREKSKQEVNYLQ